MRLQRMGRYDVTALLGEGGMGQVWQATDTQLNRQVALKILPDAFAADPDRLARFTREAQILASLNHPNIAAIYGIEEAEGTRALVLELVEGPTLADRIAKGPIPLDEALPIAKQIAEALEAAHEAGVIHRDLKPANIKVREDGTVKVLDFGLAKAFQPNASDPGLSASPTISLTAAATQMGMVIGTAAYMAPEQASGKVVDKRADIWAFGAVLYEMLTGRRAFSGEDVSHTLAAVLMKEIDWTALSKDTPETVCRLLRRSLERDPRKRMRDIGEARQELEDPQPAPIAIGTVGPPQLQLWQRPLAALGIVVVAVLLASLAVWNLTRPGPQAVSRFEIPFRTEEILTGLGRHAVAVSPDGRQIVYVTTDGLALRSLNQLTPVLLAGTDGSAREPFFSADGQSIGFFTRSGNQLQKISTSGGAPVALGEAVNPWGASWGADDVILYGQGPDGIWRVPGTGGTREAVITVEAGELAHGPQMLPGEWVLFTLRPASTQLWDESQIVMQSLASEERVVLIEGGRDARYIETGHLVYVLNGVLSAVAFDLDARQVLGGPVPLIEGIRATPTTGAAQFSIGGNGSLVYAPGAGGGGGTYSLSWLTRAGEENPTAAPARTYGDMRVSPDGTRIAVDVLDQDNTDIWIWNLDDGPLTRLTFDEAVDAVPLWTPDSQRVVFASSREGGGLFWRAADGTGEVERLLESTNRPRPWGWSTDGRLLLDQRPGDIGVLTVEGDRTVEILLGPDFRERAPALSPDGRWIAYLSDESGRNQIYVRPFPNVDDGKWQVSTNGGTDPVWSTDGRQLFFVDIPNRRLMVANVETDPAFSWDTPTELVTLSGFDWAAGGRRYDLAPDGERFVVRKIGGAQTTGGAAFDGLIFVENWFEELKERVPVN